MSDNKVFQFKLFYQKFLAIDRWICQKRATIDPGSTKWQELVSKFVSGSIVPLERAWSKLTVDEKNQFNNLMGWR